MAEIDAMEKVKKLLRLARDEAAAEGEVANALKAARALMDRYGIEESSIILDHTAEQLQQTMTKDGVVQRGKVYKDELFMAHVVDAVCDTRHYQFRTMRGETLFFYGFQRNVAIAGALFKELMSTMRKMARNRFGQNWGTEHHDYGLGMIHCLWNRASAMKQARVNGSGVVSQTCTAVILKTDAALEKMTEALGIVEKKARPTKVRSFTSYSEGNADGRNISLNTNQMGGSTKPQPHAIGE